VSVILPAGRSAHILTILEARKAAENLLVSRSNRDLLATLANPKNVVSPLRNRDLPLEPDPNNIIAF
jgi:hypothetical protein